MAAGSKALKTALCFLSIVIASNPVIQSQARLSSKRTSAETLLADLTESAEVIRKHHAGGKTTDIADLTASAIASMLESLDPHSTYFNAEDFQILLEEQESEYYGIGATIAEYVFAGEINTYILLTYPGSAAAKAKLSFGDKILSVNGENMSGQSSEYVRDKVRGPDGTTVKLTVERSTTKRPESVELKRGRVPQPSIRDHYLLTSDVGYIDLSDGFNRTTLTELNKAYSSLRKSGMRSLILDLRENPGGLLEQAVKVAEKFLPRGNVIVTQRGRSRADNIVWRSNNRSPETIPLVILVGKNSASASEVVAGALQDHDRALIVGEKTFGKGLVQSVFRLPEGAGLAITTSRYFTPSGRSIQRDYENGGLYDYFAHRDLFQQKSLTEARTSTNRPVFGGDGIKPDEEIAAAELSEVQSSMIDDLFFFTKDFINRPATMNAVIDLTSVMDAFKKYIQKTHGEIGGKLLETEQPFIETRLRYNLAIAARDPIGGNRLLNTVDPQISAARSALPRARQLASTSNKK
ncbi:MAG: S41 family peptidase [Pyrinomonadaceae bacterium]